MRIAIVGAGMAGLACAQALKVQGHQVRLFDKGRGPGGRMSSRRTPTRAGEAQFDHGAQYFKAQDDAFRQQVETWRLAAVVAPWPAVGSDAWVGVPAMNALVRHMAEPHAVTWSAPVTRLEPLNPGWRLHFGMPGARPGTHPEADQVDADLVLVAIPAEQVAALLAPVAPDLSGRAGAISSAPCWTAMLAFDQPVPAARDCWRSDGAIAWATRNNAKPGRTGPESWVIQASAAWTQQHLEAAPETVLAALQSALVELLDVALPEVISASAHRWRYALPVTGTDALAAGPGPHAVDAGALFDPARGLGVCGDWLIGPRVEAAWQSGVALAAQVCAAAAGTAPAAPAAPGAAR